jgi:multicomponent K+:H+ antiporter subunit D
VCGPPALVGAVRGAKQFLTYVSSGPFQPAIAVGLGLPDSFFAELSADLQAKRDRLVPGPAPLRPALIGGLFFATAVAIAGMPPLGGFIGKAMLLGATLPATGAPGVGQAWLWAAILGGSLFAMLALSRAGSALFWKGDTRSAADAEPAGWRDTLPLSMALAAIVAITVFAAPMQRYAQATARDLLSPAPLIDQTLRTAPRPGPHQPAPETFR